MASRRMFSGQKIETDKFLDLDPRTQALQFHLILNADDDGFVAKPKAIVRMCGCNLEDLKALIANDYLIQFDSGVVVIKDWKVHNFIRKDRYHPSLLPERDLICWTKKGEYLLKEEAEQAYDPESGEMGYPEGYIHYFDENQEIEKKEERKKRGEAESVEDLLPDVQEELPSEPPVDDCPAELAEDYPDDSEDFPSPTPASPADSPSLDHGSPLVANWVPEVRAIDRDRGYSQSYSKKPLHHYCGRTPEPQYCTTVIGDCVSALSKFSNSTTRG